MRLSTVTVNTHNKTLGVSPTDVTEQGEHADKILTPSLVPSRKAKRSNHRDTPIKKDVGFTLSLISIENSSNAL